MTHLTPDHHRLIDAAKASDHCGVVIWWCGRTTIYGPEGVCVEVTPNTQPHAAARALGLTLHEEPAA